MAEKERGVDESLRERRRKWSRGLGVRVPDISSSGRVPKVCDNIRKIYNIRVPKYYITGQSDNLSIGFYIYSFKFINTFVFYPSEIKF